MAYNALNNLIDAYIYANGVQAITGSILNNVLKAMVSQLGGGYNLMGVAAPASSPAVNDEPLAYFAATAGTYTNFDGITLAAGEVAVLLTSGNGSWSKQTIYNVPTGTADLENTANFITNAVTDLVNYYTKTEVDDTLANYPTLEGLATALADYYDKTEVETLISTAGNGEDIDSNADGKLQFANRVYNTQQPNGMGYKILRKDATFASQVTDTNTIYEIRYDFSLGGATVTIPSGCVLKFNGGRISNGTVNGNKTYIDAGLVKIFENDAILGGNFEGDAHPEWYGGIRGVTGMNVSAMINRLYGGFDSVVLESGTYHCVDTITIGAKYLRGNGFNSVLQFNGFSDNFTAVTYGNVGGSPLNRLAGGGVSGISIVLLKQSSPVYGTSCFTFGAMTRGRIKDLRCENRNYRTGEFTAVEFETPESYTNYGFVVDGSVELSYVYGLVSTAGIPLYFKTSCDSSNFDRGYLETRGYGFSGIYGNFPGTNVSIRNYNIALGIYGVFCKSTSASSSGFWEIDNLRIEQLRVFPNEQYADVSCSVYLNSTGLNYGGVIKNSVMCSSKNIAHIGGATSVKFIDCLVESDSNTRDYTILVDDNSTGDIVFERFISSVNAPLLIPSGYKADGYAIPKLYGGGTQDNAKPFNMRLSPGANQSNYERLFAGTSRYECFAERHNIQLASGNSTVIYSSTAYADLRSQITRTILYAEIFNDNVYAHYVLQLWIENGELKVKQLNNYGDDISVPIGSSAVSGKFSFFIRNATTSTATLEVYNRIDTNLYAHIKYILHSKDIIQRLPSGPN